MNIIRFEVEGLINSFRIPFFRSYHKSFLAPPKTTIIGMLCNIALKPQKEFYEILEQDKIELSVIINSIKGRTKDLWSFKTMTANNRGKSVIRRDKLFSPSYTIYLKIEDSALFEDFYNALLHPKNTPALGLDDELIHINEVQLLNTKDLIPNDSKRVDSIFLDKFSSYKGYLKDISKPAELPLSNMLPTKFRAFDKKGKRIPKEVIQESEYAQVEFINCEIEFTEEVPSYRDISNNNRLVFY